ncbi:MAG: prephenate dehydratase [Planctomycetota bacterium]
MTFIAHRSSAPPVQEGPMNESLRGADTASSRDQIDGIDEQLVSIVDEELLAVEHCIAVVSGTMFEGLREVRSQPVA